MKTRDNIAAPPSTGPRHGPTVQTAVALLALASAITPVLGADGSASAAKDASEAIRPFHVEVPESELADLRSRIKATKWPERETVTDQSQGVQLHYNRLPKDGHFAAWEQPELFTKELRAAFTAALRIHR